MATSTIFLVSAALLTGLYLGFGRQKHANTPKLPIISDFSGAPLEKPLLNWDTWSKANGPVAKPKLYGILPVVIINTMEAATELLSRRSNNYSNRPSFVTIEMVTNTGPGKSKFTHMHDNDAEFRLYQRMLTSSLGAVAAPRYQPLIELEGKQMLAEILELLSPGNMSMVSSDDLYVLFERAQTSLMLALHYGIRATTASDPLLHELIGMQNTITHLAASPSLPDIFPFLRHLPAVVSPWRKAANRLYHVQREFYVKLLESGKRNPGWNATIEALSVAAKHAGPNTISDENFAFLLATSVHGGAETSPRQTLWLAVAAVCKPSCVQRAQKVLDDVVGRDRLPTFTDRPRLAYVEAVVLELMRWRPVAPSSIVRRADDADEYRGVHIAKGTTVFSNTWAISRDADAYDDKLGDLQDFCPERWLESRSMDKLRADLPVPIFGQGRRSCPGKRVGMDGMFLSVSLLLWAFDFNKAEEIDPDAMAVWGFTAAPALYKVRLKPRGPWVSEVVNREWTSAEKHLENLTGNASQDEA
ncbi:hypothetical protein DL769_005210 [Monosporascus sp. CRB-8-3]|nr:hypothetical protein DL769_005210 [Monosporascus sp. CRB-8-3]